MSGTQDEDFIAIGSVEDDRLINKMNKKDSSKGEEIKQESKEEVKEEDKGEEHTRKRKHATDEDKEVDYEILDKKYPIIDWKTENLGTKPQFDESKRSDENPPPPPQPSTQQTPTQQTPHTVSTIKLPILKKGEYDIWAMKMEHYLAHTDYPIWEVIQNRNGPVSVTTDISGQIKILPPKTGEEVVARERERKARTALLMAIPEDHLAKFHKMTDTKGMWNAIKSRFGGNDESKKMQKYILKQQFEGFTVSNTDGIHKGYERFQSLLSHLEIHGVGVSTEDANHKFLRSLPSAWLQVSLIMSLGVCDLCLWVKRHRGDGFGVFANLTTSTLCCVSCKYNPCM
ncbi:hypothetical protein Tco_0510900 [Tanacetum coccineum]